MREERAIIKGFYRNEEEETSIYEEEQFIPLPEEEQNSINITRIIWIFTIVITLIFGMTTTSLVFNILTKKKIDKIEQYEQGRDRNNTSECSQSIYISRTSDGVWEIKDCSR